MSKKYISGVCHVVCAELCKNGTVMVVKTVIICTLSHFSWTEMKLLLSVNMIYFQSEMFFKKRWWSASVKHSHIFPLTTVLQKEEAEAETFYGVNKTPCLSP